MRYTVEVVEPTVCICHQLNLPYDSPCNNVHGHNYRVVVRISADALDACGMVVDFTHVKRCIRRFDHGVLGVIVDGRGSAVYFSRHYPDVEPSTAECFATRLFRDLSDVIATLNPHAKVDSVSVFETSTSEVLCSQGEVSA